MKPSKLRRKQGRALARIQATARQRQDAWRETDQPDVTEALALKLERLYADRREEMPESGSPYRGRTMSFNFAPANDERRSSTSAATSKNPPSGGGRDES